MGEGRVEGDDRGVGVASLPAMQLTPAMVVEGCAYALGLSALFDPLTFTTVILHHTEEACSGGIRQLSR